MPRRVDASPSHVSTDGRPSVSGKRAQSARKPAVPRFVRGDEKTREARTRARGTRANEPTREEDGEDGASAPGAADPGAADPAHVRSPSWATATGAAMCAAASTGRLGPSTAPASATRRVAPRGDARQARRDARGSPRHAAESPLSEPSRGTAPARFRPGRGRRRATPRPRGQALPQPTPVLASARRGGGGRGRPAWMAKQKQKQSEYREYRHAPGASRRDDESDARECTGHDGRAPLPSHRAWRSGVRCWC